MNSMENTVLAWLQKELNLYSKLLLISPVRDLSFEYWQGKPLLCLAHRYFPDSIPNLLEQLKKQQQQVTLTTYCYQLFHDTLGADIPQEEESWIEYLFHIYTAIDMKKQDNLLRELHIGDKNSSDEQLNLETYSNHLLSMFEKLFNQLIEITTRESNTSRSTSPRIHGNNNTVSSNSIEETVFMDTQPIAARFTTTTTTLTTTIIEDNSSLLMSRQDIESNLLSIEQKELTDYNNLLDTLPLTVKQHPDIVIYISAIDATHAAIHLQLHKGDILRTTIGFTNTAASIRNELEFIQAKMLKTTTTDTGIQDLEYRAKVTGKSIENLNNQYKQLLSTDEIILQEYQSLCDKYQLICSWVDDVRVWFVEAERIRTWIEERIKILEDKQNLNALDEIELDYEIATIHEFNGEQQDLEKQVELFDKEDMTRLRAHVKALTGGNKDLSPADTTTIEITFTTLMTLDRLMHLLRRHSYELQILTLRTWWEQEYNVSISWVRSTSEQVKIFVQQKARWRPPPFIVETTTDTEKNEIIEILIDFEKQSSTFDVGQFTTTVNMYQDLDDACNVELPSHLESRQVALEESFEELTNRISFARQVVEQYLVVDDFLDRADKLKNEGDELRLQITLASEQHEIVKNNNNQITTNTNGYSEKVSLFQENVVRLVTGVAARVPYPEATHPTDEQGNDDANEVIRMVIGARKSALVLFGEALDQSLSTYRRSLQLQKRAKQLQDEISRIMSWVDERMRSIKKSKVDVFVGKCALDESDLARLKKELDGQVSKLNGIKENEIKRLLENIQALQASSSQPPKNQNTVTLVSNLNDWMIELEDQLVVLNDALQVHSLCLDILGKRISWETQYSKSSVWISNTTFQIWEFVSRKAQWRADVDQVSDRSLIQSEFEAMENKVQEFHVDHLKLVDQTFKDLVNGFGIIIENNNNDVDNEQPKDNITPEHVQRRQDTLDQSYHNLCDLIEFTKQVLSQHTALSAFNILVKELSDKGHVLIQNIQNANQSVMKLSQVENKRQHFITDVKQFEKDVIQLWMEHGSQLPYPQCPEDARATRPTTNDDEISTEVATVVFNTYTELQELLKKMTEILQTFDISIVYRTKLEKWCSDTDELNNTIKTLSHQVEREYIFDLQSGIVKEKDETSIIPVDIYLTKANEYSEKLNGIQHESYEPLLTQLEKLKQALEKDNGVTTVEPSITEESMSTLDTSWQSLNHAITLFNQQSTVCKYNVKWQSLWNDQWTFMNQLQDKVREWNNEKNLYTSRGESVMLESLVTNLEKAEISLQTRLDDDFPTLKTVFSDMMTSYKPFKANSDIQDYTASLETKQDDLEKLVLKLKEMVSSQFIESKILKARHDWETDVDNELKLCTENALETESFIRKSARWSTDAEDIDSKLMHTSAEARIKSLSTLSNNLSQLQSESELSHTLTQTESIFKKKAVIESTIEKIQHHVEFMDQVLLQRSTIILHLDKVSELENLADSIKTQFLSKDVLDGQEQDALKDYTLRISQLDTTIDLPVRHYRDHDATCREEDIAHNTFMTDMMTARKNRLDELNSSLDSILKSKESLSRCKAAEDTYMSEVKSVQDWIDIKSASLKEIEPSNTVEDLRVAVTSVGAIQSATSIYSNSIQALKESASHCILLIQQQEENDEGKHIQSTQASVESFWELLLNDIQEKKNRLTNNLHHTEFISSVDSFNEQCALFVSKVKEMDISSVTEQVTHEWQNDIQALESESIEHIRSRLSKEKIKSDDEHGVTQYVLKEMNDLFTKALKNFDELKSLVKERTTEANHHRFKGEYFTTADSLDACIAETNEALSNLKSSSQDHIIHGTSTENDKATVDKIAQVYANICDMVEQHTEKYDEQRSFYRFLQLNKVNDLFIVDVRQQDIEQRWKQLKTDVSNDKQYVDSVSRWFDLHTKLNEMQSEALDGIFKRLDQMTLEDDIMPTFLDQDTSLLGLLESRLSACWDIASSLVDDGNLDCFKKRYDQVQNDVRKAEILLKEKKEIAQKHVDFLSCQKQIGEIQNSVKKVVDGIDQRIDTLVVEDDSSKGIEQLFRSYSSAVSTTESQQNKLLGQITSVIEPLVSLLNSKYPEDSRLVDIQSNVDSSKSNLNTAFSKEQAIHDMMRRVLGHSKSVENISDWIENCNLATSQVLKDQLEEGEASLKIENLSQKLADFGHVMDSFKELSTNLLMEEADTLDILKQLHDLVKKNSDNIESNWKEACDQLESVESTVQKTARGVAIARKFKIIMAMVGETRDYVTSVKLFDNDDACSVHTQDAVSPIDQLEGDESDDDKTKIGGMVGEDKKSLQENTTQQPLLSMLRQSEVKDIERHLLSMESDIKPQIKVELDQLDTMISEFEDIGNTFIRQHQEVKESVTSLYQMLTDKYTELKKAMDVGKYLTIADDIDILQSSLEEAVSKSSAPHSFIGNSLSRTDLQAKLIELDARFNYYERKIVQNLASAKEQAAVVISKKEPESVLVESHLQEMEQKWALIKKQFKKRKIELSRTIDTSMDPKDPNSRIRKSSLPTRKASSLLRDRGDLSLTRQQRLSPTASSTTTSSSTSSSTKSNNNRLNPNRSTTRYLAPPFQHQPSKSATHVKTTKTGRPTTKKQPLNSYVADPKNDLDIEIGRIVNETPYRVKVKMVPGEVGRYWFGDLNPKLAYCRVLKSKMVMVRVGGGWTELSQFLRDHALLEGDFIPRSRRNTNNLAKMIPEEEEPKSPTIQEGFIETRRDFAIPRQQRHRSTSPNTRPQFNRSSTTTTSNSSSSRSNTTSSNNNFPTGSPSHSASTNNTGYKDGDKFITLDQHGNQLEVKMRKVNEIGRSSNMNASTSSSNDYTRRRIARKKEKNNTNNINTTTTIPTIIKASTSTTSNS